MGAIGLHHYMMISAFLLATGITCMVTKRNAIGILMGIELVLNAASLNFVALGKYTRLGLDGQIFSLFIIVLAAAEAAIALAIVLNYYNNFVTIDVDRGDELKG